MVQTSEQNSGVRHSLRVSAGMAGTRLDQALAAGIETLSRSRIKTLIEAACVRVDERTIVEPSFRVKPGQALAVSVPPAAPAVPLGQAMDLDIHYEDDDLIIIDKPAGLVVHPAPGHPDRTLVNALIAHCGASLTGIGGERRPGIVHRLDKDTSGLMVAAKTARAHASLTQQFAARSIGRAYYAVVWGVPLPLSGEIEGNIGRNPRNRKKMAVVARGGKEALTMYVVTRQLLDAGKNVASLVECRLATGRTHQIRVHMTSTGHGIIGDPLYGRGGRRAGLTPALQAAVATLGRQALHAFKLDFDHPKDGARHCFESKLPQDINFLLRCFE
ncbi:MAG: RluA family pseudouridine synthase [Alphaproteobacteria bacterium]